MMDSHTSPIDGFNKQEPIPGYITKELLGRRRVRRSLEVPCARRLVQGRQVHIRRRNIQARHRRELRSLNRIKEVRHPFLLSIERIEVIDDNVVIVTELADQSLKRQFQKQRAKGLPGLPREELLGYLRDTADALDYIYDNYSLQHLDIKPENLLLVGNRAKVADFGLIKNLYDRSSVSIEGLTPTYAPPELFEGKPNRHSDQYSLAIVYSEMLTGELPFRRNDAGTTRRPAPAHGAGAVGSASERSTDCCPGAVERPGPAIRQLPCLGRSFGRGRPCQVGAEWQPAVRAARARPTGRKCSLRYARIGRNGIRRIRPCEFHGRRSQAARSDFLRSRWMTRPQPSTSRCCLWALAARRRACSADCGEGCTTALGRWS